MKPHYHYCSIGDKSAHLFCEYLNRGESVVVIGPRGAGKRYLLEYVNRLRRRVGAEPFATVALADADSALICRDTEMAGLLAKKSGLQLVASIDEWADAVRVHSTPENPVRLFVTNLDAVSKTLAHRLLTCVQSLVKARLLITVITGEGNLIDLVDGSPASAWSCAHQFVVHAHDRRHFHRFLTKRMRQSRMLFPETLTEAKSVVRDLYERTGGDVTLLRALIWGISDNLNHHFEHPPKGQPVRITKGMVPMSLTDTQIVPVAGVVPFRDGCNLVLAAATESSMLRSHSSGLGASAPTIHDLETMLWSADKVHVMDEPHLLELAGLARREEGVLKWFSPLTETFITRFYSRRDIADLYAFAHQWNDAYRLYDELHPEEKCRPLSDDDQIALMRLLDGVAIQFHRIIAQASNSPDGAGCSQTIPKLRDGLRQALEHLMGIPPARVTFWILDWLGRWVCTCPEGAKDELPARVRSAWAGLAAKSSVGLAEEELHENQGGYQWVVCRDHDNKPSTAVLVNGIDDPLRDHPVRVQALHRLFRGYRRAREQCLVAEHGLRERAEGTILNAFWMLTKEAAWDTESLLVAIAPAILAALRSVRRIVYLAYGYPDPTSSALIPLYDSDATDFRIRDYAARTPSPDFLSFANLDQSIPLDAETANRLFSSSLSSPFQRDVASVKLPGVKGLLLFEQAADQAFSQSDFIFVINLAARIKPSWDQGLRLKLLHESIDAIPSPSLLLDRNRRILFANQQARELLQLPIHETGWQTNPVPIEMLRLVKDVAEALIPADSRESRLFENLTEAMKGTWLRECRPLDGNRGRPRGWVIIFRDRALLYQSFELFRELEATDDYISALRLIMESIKRWLGVKAARLRFYERDPNNPKQLIGRLSTGLNEEHKQQFESGGCVWHEESDYDAWLCLHKKEPIAFGLREDEASDSKGQTPRGLEYRRIAWDSKFELLEREVGDLSIDFPLLSKNDVLGKLTINFRPEEVNTLPAELLMQFGALSVVLGNLLDRVQRNQIRQRQIEIDTEQAMATTAHNLLSQISPFGAFIARYRLREPMFPELKSINDDLEAFHEQARKSVRRIKDRIGAVTLNLAEMDLVEVIESGLRTVVYEEGEWYWEIPPEPVVGFWDQDHLKNAVIELAHNSRDFVKPDIPLRIALIQEFTPQDGQPWIVLQYRDNGSGVPADLKTIIFEGHSFRQSQETHGRGIGLAYVRRVIEAHGGTIQEVGRPGDGAVFEICLPIHSGVGGNEN